MARTRLCVDVRGTYINALTPPAAYHIQVYSKQLYFLALCRFGRT